MSHRRAAPPRIPARRLTNPTYFAWPAWRIWPAPSARARHARVASRSASACSRKGIGRGSSSTSSLCSMAAPRSSITLVPTSWTSLRCARGSASPATSTWCWSPPGPTSRPTNRTNTLIKKAARPVADRAIVVPAGAAAAQEPRVKTGAHQPLRPVRMVRPPRHMPAVLPAGSANC